MPPSIVTCENLVKIYKVADLEVVALQGLDLEVAPGEMLALVGASGSGKSTLLNILGGLDAPSAGRCQVAGFDLARLTESQRTDYRRTVTGHVWQQSGRNLLPDLTISENIQVPQVLAGIAPGARQRRTDELLNLIGLAALARKRPMQLSGGEQQRAALAVALANGPQILLADEPTGELDSQTAHGMMGLLRHVNRQTGITIITVTHDPSIAGEMDRTIAIRDGRTSTETVRRDAPLAAGMAERASAIIGLPGTTHRESVLIDRAGRLQLPKDAIERIPFNGRADVRIVDDHVELWPVDEPEISLQITRPRLREWEGQP
jgi:ABC-type lipoprotein export system ATPase subunit